MRNQYRVLAERYEVVKDAVLQADQGTTLQRAYDCIVELKHLIGNNFIEYYNKIKNNPSEADSEYMDTSGQVLVEEVWPDWFNQNFDKINNYLSKNSSANVEGINFTGVIFQNFKNLKAAGSLRPYKNTKTDQWAAHITLMSEFLRDYFIAEKGSEEEKTALQKTYATLYHEYVHFKQFLKHKGTAYDSLKSDRPDTKKNNKPFNATRLFARYHNNRQELMAQASSTANEIIKKYGIDNAINKFNEYMNREDVKEKMNERGYTRNSKNTFYKYVIDYIKQFGQKNA